MFRFRRLLLLAPVSMLWPHLSPQLALAQAMAASRRLAAQNLLRLGMLLLLLLVPPVVYAASITLPHVFVNGTQAEADEMNANFAAVVAAVNDNDSRLDTLVSQSCPAGEVVTGVDAAGNLLCAPPF